MREGLSQDTHGPPLLCVKVAVLCKKTRDPQIECLAMIAFRLIRPSSVLCFFATHHSTPCQLVIWQIHCHRGPCFLDPSPTLTATSTAVSKQEVGDILPDSIASFFYLQFILCYTRGSCAPAPVSCQDRPVYDRFLPARTNDIPFGSACVQRSWPVLFCLDMLTYST